MRQFDVISGKTQPYIAIHFSWQYTEYGDAVVTAACVVSAVVAVGSSLQPERNDV